jgi:hypothetical protein
MRKKNRRRRGGAQSLAERLAAVNRLMLEPRGSEVPPPAPGSGARPHADLGVRAANALDDVFEQTPTDEQLRADLRAMAERWRGQARRNFASASTQADDFGRRFVEHGATCTANCLFELLRVLGDEEPPPSATLEAPQTTPPHLGQ